MAAKFFFLAVGAIRDDTAMVMVRSSWRGAPGTTSSRRKEWWAHLVYPLVIALVYSTDCIGVERVDDWTILSTVSIGYCESSLVPSVGEGGEGLLSMLAAGSGMFN